ncbi:MAG: phosphoribosylanthranilate isomerase [Alphaproteobacteria bacterium]|nr:MAG: phosphoribosylanthranilate isomerase [Alphaproteobacteria bacterium]
MIRVKICGLTDEAALAAAQEAGAAYLGFVFFARSPRCLTPERAAELTASVRPGLARVGLFVDPDDALIGAVLDRAGIDIIQLHGHETPERVAALREMTGLPVMKALGIAEAADLDMLPVYEAVADQILVDARPPKGAPVPGGNGIAFDWRLIAGRRWARPWMLAGGLRPENVAEAIRLTGVRQVDVSSGVESAPGIKDPDRIRAFMAATRALEG